jgi:RNA polymerase sigma factor (sigma-70 family)
MSTSPDTFEAQASACLQEAVALRPQLLRYASKLTNGNEEQAFDLVQEASLKLHDIVQGKGLPGGPIKATLFVIMRNLWRVDIRQAARCASVNSSLSQEGPGEELEHPALQQYQRQRLQDDAAAEQTAVLGEAATVALASSFPLADRVLFRLSAEGYSCRDIDEMTGRAKSSVARTLDRMRTQLQQMLRPLLGEA